MSMWKWKEIQELLRKVVGRFVRNGSKIEIEVTAILEKM